MRSGLCSIGPVVVALLTTVLLGIASAFVSALALAATALIVPGTGTPNANIVAGYRENARNWYLQGTACTNEANCPAATNLIGIDYPASFWPLPESLFPGWCVPGRCEKWDDSVSTGTEHLIDALTPYLTPTSPEHVVLFGYSQGGDVVADTLTYLNGLDLPDATKERLEVVTIGGIENPDGGLWQRLAGWWPSWLGSLPILDISFDPGMPVDTGIHTTAIGFEYDPVTYAPLYWGNPLALLNMVAAFETVHGYYLSPNGNNLAATLPYGYTTATLAPQLDCDTSPANCRYDSYGNTYVMIPATSLPLTDQILSLADSAGATAIVKPLVDLLGPVTKVLVDLGYDWSGDPGVSKPLSFLPFNPFENWLAVGVKLVVATVQGVQAFLGDLGVGTPATTIAPATPAPALLAAKLAAPPVAGEKQDVTTSGDVEASVGDATVTTVVNADADAEADVATVKDGGVAENGQAAAATDDATVADDVKSEDTVKADATKADETKTTDETKADETKTTDTTKADDNTPKKKSSKPSKAEKHQQSAGRENGEKPSEKADSDNTADKAA